MGAHARSNLKGSRRLGSYLHRLRTGYGYSMRGVGERARVKGGEIDNSQLSRYEKGICYPSFDKLRILAAVFNVSVQSFSEMVDLETIEPIETDAAEPQQLIDRGIEALKSGDNGRSFAYFESALESLQCLPADAEREALIGSARVNQAVALTRLGRLALAEQELREALRHDERLSPLLCTRALLALANIQADRGDTLLGQLGAERAYQVARAHSLTRLSGMALHTLGRLLSDRGQFGEAIERYREALRIYGDCDEHYETTRVRINIGSCYISLGKTREGTRLIRTALDEARRGGHRRLESRAWSNLGEAYYRRQDYPRANRCFRESGTLASFNNEKQPDILFLNAFYQWKMSIDLGNSSREKIAFGRLRTLRPRLERLFAEVREFDRHVERGRH